MSLSIKGKLPNTGITIFTVMTDLAAKYQAINLSQGFPDFAVDKELIKLVNHYMKKGLNQYAPMIGIEPLRQILSDIIFRQHGYRYDVKNEVTITSGATEAIAAAISCSIREGDEVIIFTPAYDCYAPMVELNGGTPVYIQLQHPDYSIDWDTVRRLLNHRTRMIIINTPHNPSATVLSHQDMLKLQELTEGSNILLLSDEVYEQIVFAPAKNVSVSAYPQLAARSFKIGSMGKTLHATGWKIGYCMAPALLTEEFRKIHQFLVFSVNTPMQYAIADYLAEEKNLEIAEFYREKRDIFLDAIKDSAFIPLPSEATYFQLLDYSQISKKEEVEFAKELTTQYRVAAIPLSVFYNHKKDNRVLRFCFAKNEKTLREAGLLLSNIKP